jgi:3-oxoadipate CoA-transferase alpha subunit
VYSSSPAALADVSAGAVVLVSGFAGVGWPESLLRALRTGGANLLTLVCQGVWPDHADRGQASSVIEGLVADGQVAKLISPIPFYPGNEGAVEGKWRSGDLELEVIPQGVLAERIRAGGAGLGGVFLPVAADTRFGQDKEVRSIEGRDHVFEPSLRADFALLRARAADTMGNLVYQATQRNWNPSIAMAAQVCIVEVDEIFEPGGLDPELVITPGIFVDRIVQTV